MSVLTELREVAEEFYPGSKRPLVRHPNRTDEARPDPGRWDAKPKVLKVGGVDREFFTIGQLAQALGRKPVTIRTWERTGVIPRPTFRKPSQDPRGARRLYTRAQVEGVVKIAKEEGLLRGDYRPIGDTQFTTRVVALFRDLVNQQ
jgi:hypothetical protein